MTELDDLLDATLDDIEDLPEFKPFPPGAHKVLATFESEKISERMKKPYVELSFKYIECLELADPQDEAPKEKDTCSTIFQLGNEYGAGNFKLCAAPFREALFTPETTNREIVDGVTDVECIIMTNITIDKKDDTKKYLNVKQLEVL